MAVQIPVRLEVDLTSNPPVPLLDANTGAAPRIWRGNPVAVEVGVFDADGVAYDMSDVAYLQLAIMDSPTAPYVLASRTVYAAGITPIISKGDWDDGIAQQATISLPPSNTDQGLNGETSRPFWMTLTAFTTDNVPTALAAGWFTIYNPGASYVAPACNIVSYNAQTNSGLGITVDPVTLIHTERITVAGTPGVRNIILGNSNVVPGSQLSLVLDFPALDGITYRVFNVSTEGDLLASVRSTADGSFSDAALSFVSDGTNWSAYLYSAPATH